VFIKPETNNSLITNQLQLNKALQIPIAHGEGRYYCNEETLAGLKANDQILFRYCDAQGNVNEASNPNGALENIAGITNLGRNVFGMMPHPERVVDNELYNTDGRALFSSLLDAVVKA
jgi:phosphoribosylformylglycinamidine synthase